MRVRAERLSQDVVQWMSSLSGDQKRELLWPSASVCPNCFNASLLSSSNGGKSGWTKVDIPAVNVYGSFVLPAANEAAVLAFLRQHYGRPSANKIR